MLRQFRGPGLQVCGLKAEYLETPIGIEVLEPRFSWRLLSSRRNLRQTAYRIIVASTQDALDFAKPDLWDSGRVSSDRCFEVPYVGRLLQSGQRAFWQVCVWDDEGGKAEAASWFEMGLLQPGDWHGDWLVAEDEEEAADRAAGVHWLWADVPNGEPAFLRYRLELPDEPRRAELLISVKDKLHGLWLNGEAIDVPQPVFWGTMCRLPVTLVAGSNVLCVKASALTQDFLSPDGGAISALLRIEAADKTVTRLVPHWHATGNPGADWLSSCFDDSGWSLAVSSKARMQCEPLPAYPARLLRRAFTIAKPVAQARLYATALGVYEAFLNGQRIGDARLTPEISTASHHLFYQSYNVTRFLRRGANALGFHIGDGWYGGAFGWRNERFSLGESPKRLRAQLIIDYEDGSREIVATDRLWRCHASPVLAAEIYNGERVDARRIIRGWCEPGFDDARWAKAPLGIAPSIRLVAQSDPPIRALKTREPVSIWKQSAATSIYDFGQNFSGWCRVRAKGKAGTAVTLRYAEILKPTGEIDQSNLRGAAATDSFLLAGDPTGEVFEPSFTYHGFRYVEVHGGKAVEAVVAHSALPEVGAIRIENRMIQALCDNTMWSQRSNFFGVPTDCPQRDERMGWMGDILVFLDAACFTMDTDAFIRRFLHEVRAGQSAEGAYPVVTPQPRSFPPMHTAGWSEAGVVLPWMLYERYGDTRVIDENWEAMCRWMQFVRADNPDWLWRHKRGLDLGDWLSVDAVQPADETTPRILAATAFWAYAAELMVQMAAATGRAAEYHHFREEHRAIVEAFRTAFVAPDGVVGNGSQTSYVLASKFGLVPAPLRTQAAAHLAAGIAGRGMKLSTGFLGTPYLLDVLCDHGQSETAIALLLQTDYPSWGYMIQQGATTIWERWNGDVGDIAMNSYSHYALGAVVGFIYRRLAGIAPAAPGFRRIMINPLFDPRIGTVEAEYHSVLGRIASRISGDAAGLSQLSLSIPPNSTAEVHLPRHRFWRESGVAITDKAAGLEHEIVLEVGSGEYRFES